MRGIPGAPAPLDSEPPYSHRDRRKIEQKRLNNEYRRKRRIKQAKRRKPKY